MPENAFAFTMNRVAALKPPDTGRYRARDTRQPGLAVVVTAAGNRTYYLYKKVAGRPVEIRIGAVEEVTLDAARKVANAILTEIHKGNDPQAERREKRREATLDQLWAHWLESHAKVHKRSWKGDEWQYQRFLKPWAGRRLSSIKKADVQALHAKVGRENGHYQANRVLALLRAMLNKAADVGYRGENPAKGVKRFTEESRDRFLTAEELQRFFAALHQDPSEDMQDFFVLALLTGGRRGNVASMRWEDLHLELALWRIPGAVAKAKAVIVVPLVPAAVEILTRRKQAINGSPWVFPSYGKTGHIVEVKGAWKRILERAKLADVRPHDLRRTLGSWQAMQGASLSVIGKSLGHQQVSTTAVYARLQLAPVRQSVENATTAMLAAGNGNGGHSHPETSSSTTL